MHQKLVADPAELAKLITSKAKNISKERRTTTDSSVKSVISKSFPKRNAKSLGGANNDVFERPLSDEDLNVTKEPRATKRKSSSGSSTRT